MQGESWSEEQHQGWKTPIISACNGGLLGNAKGRINGLAFLLIGIKNNGLF
jgi:hypothetical protein